MTTVLDCDYSCAPDRGGCRRQWPMESVARIGIVCGLLLGTLYLPIQANSVQADEEAVVVEDDATEAVVSDDDTDAEGSTATGGWRAQPVFRRPVRGTPAYTRQSTEAYFSPDDPQRLELKYFFDMSAEPPVVAGTCDRRLSSSTTDATNTPPRFQVAPALEHPELAESLVRLTPSDTAAASVPAQWLDPETPPSRKGPLRRQVVLLAAPGGDRTVPVLAVFRAQRESDVWTIDRLVAQRELPTQQLPEGPHAGGCLDAWDRPASLGSKAMFFGRIIALVNVADDRYVVDFFGEKLHPDSDCRVWLTPTDHPWGQPVAIRFHELPLRRQSAQVTPASVLAIVYQDGKGQRTQIAIDYPICITPIVAQFRQLSGRSGQSTSEQRPQDLMGPEILEEYECRLVNAQYR